MSFSSQTKRDISVNAVITHGLLRMDSLLSLCHHSRSSRHMMCDDFSINAFIVVHCAQIKISAPHQPSCDRRLPSAAGNSTGDVAEVPFPRNCNPFVLLSFDADILTLLHS